MSTLTRTLDLVAAAAWAAVAAYFVARYARHRKLVSLMLALMALGWASACLPLDIAPWRGFTAVALAVAVGYAIIRVERTGR